MKKIFLFLALSITLLGCSDDDNINPNPPFNLIGNWTENHPTTGKHKLTFMNATQMGLGDDSEEGIIYDYTYTIENNVLIVTRQDGTWDSYPFTIVNNSTIRITGIGFYTQPANGMPIVVTFVKD
jgi:hypothetical protein